MNTVLFDNFIVGSFMPYKQCLLIEYILGESELDKQGAEKLLKSLINKYKKLNNVQTFTDWYIENLDECITRYIETEEACSKYALLIREISQLHLPGIANMVEHEVIKGLSDVEF